MQSHVTNMKDISRIRIKWFTLALILCILLPIQVLTPTKGWDSNIFNNSSFNDIAPNNDYTTAFEITTSTNQTGELTSIETMQWWKVYVNITQRFSVTLILTNWVNPSSPGYYDFDLFLYDPDLKDLTFSAEDSDQDEVSTVATISGWYYIEIRHFIGVGKYVIQFEILESEKSDNYWWSATPINESTYFDYLDNTKDPSDWFSIKLNTTEILYTNITYSREQMGLMGNIYDDQQNLLSKSYRIGNNEVVNAVAYAPGTYFIEIVAIQGAGNYSLYVETKADGELDNYWWATPIHINPGNHSGTLDKESSDPTDWFTFQMNPVEVANIEVHSENTQLDIDVNLYDQNLQLLDESTNYIGPEKVTTVASEAGIYYIKLDAVIGKGNYSLYLETKPPIEISPGLYQSEFNTSISSSGVWYTFHLGPVEIAKVRLRIPIARIFHLYTYTYDQGLQWIDSANGDNNGTDILLGLSFTFSTWYLLIDTNFVSTNYSLSLEILHIDRIDLGLHTGILNESQDDIWYGVGLSNTTKNGLLAVELFPNRTDFDLELYSPRGELIDGSYLGMGQSEYIQGGTPISGIYVIRVIRIARNGSFELNINTEEAELVHPGTYSGYLNSSSPIAIYGIELKKADRILAILTTSTNINLNLELLHSDGSWYTGSYKLRGFVDVVSVVAHTDGIYFLRICCVRSEGTYNLQISIQSNITIPSDLAGNFPQAARFILPGIYHDDLNELDIHDYYTIGLEAGDLLTVEASGWNSNTDFELEVLKPDYTLHQGSWSSKSAETVSFMVQDNGLYFIHIYSFRGSDSYVLRVHLKSNNSTIPDFAGNKLSTSKLIRQNSYEDYLSLKYDPEDYYRFLLFKGDNKTITISGWDASTSDFELQILNSTSNILAISSSIESEEQIVFVAPYTGVFYIRVYSVYGNGLYVFSVLSDPSTTIIIPPKTTLTIDEFLFSKILIIGVCLAFIFSKYRNRIKIKKAQ